MKKNEDLSVTKLSPTFKEDHFELYWRYQNSRHPGSDMCDKNPEKYHQFLINNTCNTIFYEFTCKDRLLAVSVVDELIDGLSAVYTFFDPDYSTRSLGTYAILWQIDDVCERNLDWLYLGYWIKKCEKMSYKTNFRPIEGFRNGEWCRLR